MASAADYVGRTVDLCVFHGERRAGEALLLEEAVATEKAAGGTLVAGIVWLAQRCLLELLTPLGSIPYQPDRGTELLPTIASSSFVTQASAEQIASQSLHRMANTIRSEDSPEMAADTQLKDVRLDRVNFPGNGVIEIFFTITSQAGEVWSIIQPLSLGI